MIRAHRSLLLGGSLLAGLAASSAPAHAMSCQDITQMLSFGVEAQVVVDAMAGSGKRFNQSDLDCLQRAGVPKPVMDKAKSMAVVEEAPKPAPRAAPDPEPEPRSRFDQAEAVGSDLVYDEEEAEVREGDIDRYLRDYKAKKYLTASYGLFELLEQNAYPDRDTVIKYHLAKSLQALGMNHSAQHYYTDVIRKGPNHPLFKHALPRLAAIAALTGNDYTLLRIVGQIAPEAYPRQARPHLHYLMGRRSYEKGELTDAAAHFDALPANHELYPRAQYFQGLIHYERERYQSAMKAFREVIQAEIPVTNARLVRELEDLKDLSLLNIGRIYFRIENFDTAEKFYSRVERDSSYWPQSLFERAWTDFYQSDYNGTLGMLLTVESPYFTDREFIPETAYLKALSFWVFCEYDEVQRLLTLFEQRYQPVRDEMRGFIERFRTDEGRRIADQALDTYFATGAEPTTLPRGLFAKILRNRDLASFIRHLDMMDEEITTIRAQKSQWRDTVGLAMVDVIERDRALYRNRAGLAFLQAYLEQYRVVDQLLQDVDVLRFEVTDAERADYMYRASNPQVAAEDAQVIDFAVATDIIYWPFNGEFWQDELAYYRYTEQGSCK